MPTFGDLSKTITDSYDEIDECHFVPMRDFISDVALASKKKGEPRYVRVTLRLLSEELFSNPEDVASDMVVTPVIGFLRLKEKE